MHIRKTSMLVMFAVCVLLLLCLADASTAVRAQGVIVPRPCGVLLLRRCPMPIPLPRPDPLPRALPIKSIKIDAKISGQVATTHVEQVFRNDTNLTLEGTYFFPIPETAAITEFAIWDGNNRLVGEVRSREEARRIYDAIVRSQRDPGLLEYAGKNLFQASIFPIPPRSDKKLELTYTQVLAAESGTIAYRYPLGTGRNLQTIERVHGQIEIDSKEPLRNIYSPTHKTDVARSGDRRARVSFETSGKNENADFQLFYLLSRDDFGMSLVTHREPGKDGYFLLMLSPKDTLAEAEYAAKDIVFVLDTSGSMAEAGKMEKARQALLFGVNSLRAGDRFNIISFAGEEHLMESNLIGANAPGLTRGRNFVNALRPTGGTNINGALMAALAQFERASTRPKMLVFMTDGLPTVGVTDVNRIVENARAARTPGTRLFTFGVGYDVNTTLLDKLAAENSGTADYVEPQEDLEVKVSNFFAKVNYPVLTDVKLEMNPVETDLVYPRTTPDLFRGTQLVLIGRYRNRNDLADVQLRLTGKTERQSQTFAYTKLRFPIREESNDFLPRLWATRRVGWLMEQIRSNGENKELRDEIVDLGTRYGIVTPYTSYLALEPNARPFNVGRRGRPVPVPMAESRASAPSSSTASTGQAAVQASKSARAQQEAVNVVVDNADVMRVDTDAVRRVAGKTFYLRDGDVWIDAEFDVNKRAPETTLVFGSDEYFALLKREPRLGEFFALGERVVVVFDGRVYRVSSTGK